jgi:hypothetical protein
VRCPKLLKSLPLVIHKQNLQLVFVIWTRRRPPISLRRSIPSSTASLSNSSSRRTFCVVGPELEIHRNDRVDLGSKRVALYDMIGAGPWTAGSWTRLFLLLRTAFEAFLSEFLVVGIDYSESFQGRVNGQPWWTSGGIGVGVEYDNSKGASIDGMNDE